MQFCDFNYKLKVPKLGTLAIKVHETLLKLHAKFIIFAYGTSTYNTCTLCADDIYGNIPIPT